MSYHRLLLLATLCAVAAFLILVLRVAHPHHRQIALVIYGIGWIPFAWAIQKLWQAYAGNEAHGLGTLSLLSVGLALLAFLPDEPAAALAWIWGATGVWIAVRTAFGIARIWPGTRRAPLSLGTS